MRDKKYTLWIGPLQEIPSYAEYSYYDSVKRRLFLLLDRKPDGKFAEVPSDLFCEMTEREKAWFDASCREINRKWMEGHEAEASDTANAFLDLFEEELKKEARKAREVTNGQKEDSSGGEVLP